MKKEKTWENILNVLENNSIEVLTDPDGVSMNYQTNVTEETFEFLILAETPEEFIRKFEDFYNDFNTEEYARNNSEHNNIDKERLEDAKQIKNALEQTRKDLMDL